MANIITECVLANEVVVDGILYRYRFNEIRRYINGAWSLVARKVAGRWEVI